MEQVTIGKNNMRDVFGNELKIGTKVLFMQVGYRFFGVGSVIFLSPKTCVVEFEGQKVRQFPNQLINIDEILCNKQKIEQIIEILKPHNYGYPKERLNKIQKVLSLD